MNNTAYTTHKREYAKVSSLFYNLGKKAGPKIRKAKWIWHSITSSEADIIKAEHEVGKSLEEKQLIDKLPLNICDIGFVYRLFPESKILVAIRDPRDVCLSCFMQDFRLNPAYT